jgi:hypothetical protein
MPILARRCAILKLPTPGVVNAPLPGFTQDRLPSRLPPLTATILFNFD